MEKAIHTDSNGKIFIGLFSQFVINCTKTQSGMAIGQKKPVHIPRNILPVMFTNEVIAEFGLFVIAVSNSPIVLKKFEAKKIPFIIRRPLPNGNSEYWRLIDLEIIAFVHLLYISYTIKMESIQDIHMKHRCMWLSVMCGLSVYTWYNYSLY